MGIFHVSQKPLNLCLGDCGRNKEMNIQSFKFTSQISRFCTPEEAEKL